MTALSLLPSLNWKHKEIDNIIAFWKVLELLYLIICVSLKELPSKDLAECTLLKKK